MTKPELEKLFQGDVIWSTPDEKLNEAITILANETSADNHWIVRALVINTIKSQRHIDKIEGRNTTYARIIIALAVVSIVVSVVSIGSTLLG